MKTAWQLNYILKSGLPISEVFQDEEYCAGYYRYKAKHYGATQGEWFEIVIEG